ncbi:MAG: hypothetical protein M1833_000396 [Piccolia ochrophora]|nr:MAG: hypothetical protein M1833_000396 [Piccolia ochrophora]
MVHPGRPSRGCNVCRKRRIKCDEAVPVCSYCLKKQLPCPGYKSQFDVAWRDQNTVAEKSVRRRKNAIEKADREHVAGEQLARLSSRSALQILSQDYEAYALSFFFSSYIFPQGNLEGRRGCLDCLHPVWVQTHPTSPLRPAVAAVASWMLEAWSLMKPDLPLSLSRSHYLKGVTALRKSLQSTKNVGDDVLMAALMLDMYEGVCSFSKSKPKDSPHGSGTTALVECRRQLPFASETSQRVLHGARSQIIGRALSTTEPVPLSVSKWTEMAPHVLETPGSQLDDLNVEVANLRALASQLKSDTAVEGTSVVGILREATVLDQRLLAWRDSLPSDWGPLRVSGPECIPQSVRDAGLYQNHCDIYKSIFIAFTLNSHCCSRIKVQLTILACLKYLNNDHFDTATVTGLEIIQELADTICASIPYHLGDRVTTGRIDDKTVQYPRFGGLPVPEDHYGAAAAFGGWLLTTRLSELLSPSVLLRDGQRQWIGGQMSRVGRIYVVQPHKAT